MEFSKCWICKDQGMIIYIRTENGLDYDTAAKCKCIKGQQLGERIPTISEFRAVNLAKTNYGRYKEKVQ